MALGRGGGVPAGRLGSGVERPVVGVAIPGGDGARVWGVLGRWGRVVAVVVVMGVVLGVVGLVGVLVMVVVVVVVVVSVELVVVWCCGYAPRIPGRSGGTWGSTSFAALRAAWLGG